MLSYSFINSSENDKPPKLTKKDLNKTRRKSEKSNVLTKEMLETIKSELTNKTMAKNNDDEHEDDHEDDLHDDDEEQKEGMRPFNPPPPPEISTNNDITTNEYKDSNVQEHSYVEQYNSPPPVQAYVQKDELSTKLNYIIHMLQEQQSQKTDSVIEELILYCFLGVFIIFLIDSFVKVGRYTR